MFTGIVEEIGKIQSIKEHNITIDAKCVLSDVKIGDSISVNGVCLTVTAFNNNSFNADVSNETLNVTALKYLKNSDIVNLERAVSLNGRLGGHIVTGHIDGVGEVYNLKNISEFYDLYIKLGGNLAKHVVKKGSITINGVSLTVADIEKDIIKLAIIPHTYESTALKNLKIGDKVNIETDILAKYVEKFLSTSDNKKGIDIAFLQENGF